jgi:hypothetical protein
MRLEVAPLSGSTIEFDENSTITENSTIKELIKAYVNKKNRKKEGEPEYTEEEKEVLVKEILEAEFTFQLALDGQILDNDKTLKDALLKGEVTINAIKSPLLYAECLRDIKDLDSTSSLIQKLTKREEILGREIDRDREERTPILASLFKDNVLAAVQQNREALEDASEDLRKDRDVV